MKNCHKIQTRPDPTGPDRTNIPLTSRPDRTSDRTFFQVRSGIDPYLYCVLGLPDRTDQTISKDLYNLYSIAYRGHIEGVIGVKRGVNGGMWTKYFLCYIENDKSPVGLVGLGGTSIHNSFIFNN
jgi:hypothetical protein